jgi:hypothetical protein
MNPPTATILAGRRDRSLRSPARAGANRRRGRPPGGATAAHGSDDQTPTSPIGSATSRMTSAAMSVRSAPRARPGGERRPPADRRSAPRKGAALVGDAEVEHGPESCPRSSCSEESRDAQVRGTRCLSVQGVVAPVTSTGTLPAFSLSSKYRVDSYQHQLQVAPRQLADAFG